MIYNKQGFTLIELLIIIAIIGILSVITVVNLFSLKREAETERLAAISNSILVI